MSDIKSYMEIKGSRSCSGIRNIFHVYTEVLSASVMGWIVRPPHSKKQNSYVEVPPPSTSECNLIGNKVIVDVIS